MTYVSHTVRSLRRDPIPGETIRLVVTLADDAESDESATDDAAASSVAEEVESVGGEVVRKLQLGRLLVEVEQTDLDAICSLDGLRSVETDAVLGPT